MPITLRPYQTDAIQRLYSKLRSGVRRVVIVAPTGAGKTTIAAQIVCDAKRHGRRVLFLAHRRELINQAYDRLLQSGLSAADVGVIMATDPRARCGVPVQVASVDTIRNRAKPPADVVFVDECHRARSATYTALAEHYAGAIHLGLTATPYRADGKGLDATYDDIVQVSTIKQLIAEGYLVEPAVYTVPPDRRPDLSGVRTRMGDFDMKQLAAAVDKSPLVGNIVEHWIKLAGGRRTVAFATSVAHSEHIRDRFLDAGIAAEHLDGKTPTRERDAILKRLDSGETLVVSNCGVLCEGWDQPAAKCAILARPTQSMGLYLQQAGRILRPHEDQQAIILDHAGCAIMHGVPHDDREFTLKGRKKKRGKRRPGDDLGRACPGCWAIVPPATIRCPNCGYELRTKEEVAAEQEGELVRIAAGSDWKVRGPYKRGRHGFGIELVLKGETVGKRNFPTEAEATEARLKALDAISRGEDPLTTVPDRNQPNVLADGGTISGPYVRRDRKTNPYQIRVRRAGKPNTARDFPTEQAALDCVAELIEQSDANPPPRVAAYRDWSLKAHRLGYKPGWARIMYQKTYHAWPTKAAIACAERALAKESDTKQVNKAIGSGGELRWEDLGVE